MTIVPLRVDLSKLSLTVKTRQGYISPDAFLLRTNHRTIISPTGAEGLLMHLCLRLVLLILLVMLAPGAPALAQERMRIAWAGSTPSNTPIWVADQKGFFKKNGLDVEVISISASTIVIQALLTGEVDFIIAPSTTLVTSRLAGADTIMVSTNLPLFIDHIVSLAEITSVEQLKGKTGGVNRLGTTSDMTLRLALRRFGIDPERKQRLSQPGKTRSASPLCRATSPSSRCSASR